MIKKRNSIGFLELVMALIILYTIMPIVSQFISDFLTTYFYMVLLLGATIYVLTIRGTASISESFVLVLPFLFWKLLELVAGGNTIILWGYGSLVALAPLLFGVLLMQRDGPKVVNFFTLVILGAVLITVITTITGSITHPMAARELASLDAEDPAFQLYNRINLGGYQFVYICVLLYPAAIFAYKQGKIRLVFAVLASVLVLFLSLNSGYTTALLLWIASTATFFFPKNVKKRGVIILLIVAVILFLIFLPLISTGTKNLAKIVDNDDIAYRLDALAEGREGIERSDDNRLRFYQRSLDAFLASPLFGNLFGTGERGGGHSFILDFMGQYGLIGIVILFFMYRTVYIRFFKPFEKTQGYGFVFWMFLQTIALSTVNTGMWIDVLCWFMPILTVAIVQKKPLPKYINLLGKEKPRQLA